jgi:hypothetical protein
MTDTPWFTPKSHGYGAASANWRGRLAVLAFVALQAALAVGLMIRPAGAGLLTEGAIVVWVAVMAATTAAFVWLCRRKADGDRRWRLDGG